MNHGCQSCSEVLAEWPSYIKNKTNRWINCEHEFLTLTLLLYFATVRQRAENSLGFFFHFAVFMNVILVKQFYTCMIVWSVTDLGVNSNNYN